MVCVCVCVVCVCCGCVCLCVCVCVCVPADTSRRAQLSSVFHAWKRYHHAAVHAPGLWSCSGVVLLRGVVPPCWCLHAHTHTSPRGKRAAPTPSDGRRLRDVPTPGRRGVAAGDGWQHQRHPWRRLMAVVGSPRVLWFDGEVPPFVTPGSVAAPTPHSGQRRRYQPPPRPARSVAGEDRRSRLMSGRRSRGGAAPTPPPLNVSAISRISSVQSPASVAPRAGAGGPQSTSPVFASRAQSASPESGVCRAAPEWYGCAGEADKCGVVDALVGVSIMVVTTFERCTAVARMCAVFQAVLRRRQRFVSSCSVSASPRWPHVGASTSAGARNPH